MTITELESLLKRADDVLGCRVGWYRNYQGAYTLRQEVHPLKTEVFDATLDECVARLKQWATPPKPDMLPVLVPIATAEFTAEFQATGCSAGAQHARVLSSLFREALKPYQQPE